MGKLVKILSIDGGGMRGIIPSVVLAEIEHRAGQPIHKLFDIIAGTSTGAIIALGLTLPNEQGKARYSASDIIDIFDNDGQDIFSRSLWHTMYTAGSIRGSKYPPEGMLQTFNKIYGNARLKEALTEVMAVSYDIEMAQAFFFKRHEAIKDDRRDFAVKEVVQASSSAPVYFEPFTIERKNDPTVKRYAFIDGCVVANNPAMCAYAEAKTLYPNADEYLVVSLGTGSETATLLYELFDQWGAIQWIMPLVNILMGGTTNIPDHQLRALHKTHGDKLNHYYRLQAKLEKGQPPLDGTDNINTHTLRIIQI